MTATKEIQLELPQGTYIALQQAAARAHKSAAEMAVDAIQHYLAQIDPLLGLFADEPMLIDEITHDIMQSREQTPWRLSNSNRE